MGSCVAGCHNCHWNNVGCGLTVYNKYFKDHLLYNSFMMS